MKPINMLIEYDRAFIKLGDVGISLPLKASGNEPISYTPGYSLPEIANACAFASDELFDVPTMLMNDRYGVMRSFVVIFKDIVEEPDWLDHVF